MVNFKVFFFILKIKNMPNSVKRIFKNSRLYIKRVDIFETFVESELECYLYKVNISSVWLLYFWS